MESDSPQPVQTVQSVYESSVNRYFDLIANDGTIDVKQKIDLLNQVKGMILKGVEDECHVVTERLEFLNSLLKK